MTSMNQQQMRTWVLANTGNTPITNMVLRDRLSPGIREYIPELDRALQSLRREGMIEPTRKGWVRTGRKPCPHCGGSGYLGGAEG